MRYGGTERRDAMKVNRKRCLRELEAVAPGLSEGEGVEQSDCFVFQDGTVRTFNDEMFCLGGTSIAVDGAVRAKPLLKLFGRLTEDEVDVAVKDGTFVVKVRSRRAGIAMEEKITLPVNAVEKPKGWKPLHEEFVGAVDVARRCVSKDADWPVFGCVHIHPDHVEACDNAQAVRYPLATGVAEPVLVRGDSLAHVVAIAAVEFSETEAWMHFRNADGLVVSCRRNLGRYKDLGEIFGARGASITLPSAVSATVGLAEIFSSADDGLVSVELRRGKMRLESRDDSGWFREIGRVEYDGPRIGFLVMPKLFAEVLARGGACELAGGMLRVDGGKFTYVVSTVKREDAD